MARMIQTKSRQAKQYQQHQSEKCRANSHNFFSQTPISQTPGNCSAQSRAHVSDLFSKPRTPIERKKEVAKQTVTPCDEIIHFRNTTSGWSRIWKREPKDEWPDLDFPFRIFNAYFEKDKPLHSWNWRQCHDRFLSSCGANKEKANYDSHCINTVRRLIGVACKSTQMDELIAPWNQRCSAGQVNASLITSMAIIIFLASQFGPSEETEQESSASVDNVFKCK